MPSPLQYDTLPPAFWHSLFDQCADSESGHYGHAYRQSEYGVTREDFANENPKQAVEDARAYFARQSPEQQRSIIAIHAQSFREQAARLIANADELDAVLAALPPLP